ncbi:MAG: NrsF family protein [Azospirillaceae bacterium]|nr:NrsF family protein [Azospirillaceae bacterium]
MTTTDHLIESLVDHLAPVQPLAPPAVRATRLIVLATVLITLLAAARGLRADLDQRLVEPDFVVALLGSWLTGVTGTLAALSIGLPDRSRRWFLLPLPAFLVWVWGVGAGCLGHWVAIPTGAPIVADSVRCLETLVMASVPLALVLWRMLRRSRPLRAANTAWLGALAVAGFADTAHLLIHVVDPTALVLVMNLGVTGLILVGCGIVGSWRGGRLLGSPGR